MQVIALMNVIFRRSGDRRYAVVIERPEHPPQVLEPAPGYDPDIPHDLVHYVVEATLGLEAGVFGRAARGGGSFLAAVSTTDDRRARIRDQRKQRRREQRFRELDDSRGQDMLTSERLAAHCDLAWRRRHGQHPDPALWRPEQELSADDKERVQRVVAQLDVLAVKWKELPVDGELLFVWPSLTPSEA